MHASVLRRRVKLIKTIYIKYFPNMRSNSGVIQSAWPGAIVYYDSGRGEADKRASACATLIPIIKHLILDLYAYMDIKYIEIHL